MRLPTSPEQLIYALVIAIGTLLGCRGLNAQPAVEHYEGMAEASAAAALDARHFVVAEDECNTLLTYEIGKQSPVGSLKLGAHLQTEEASDIEAAARIGDIIYWISSHSLTRKGNTREERYRFFATQVHEGIPTPSLTVHGEAIRNLLRDLVEDPGLKVLELKLAAAIPPEEPGGLNIEGLASWHAGRLLIGFRSPLDKQGHAILVPLENPDAVVEGANPLFGAPLYLDLGGRGVRSIEQVGDEYLIVAGPVADSGNWSLYLWSGRRADKPMLRPETLPPAFAAEALLAVRGSDEVMVLSDDGTRNPKAGCNKPAKRSQTFQALRIQVR